LAADLERNGVNIIGTTPRSIELAEDRKYFSALLDHMGLQQAPAGTAVSESEAVAIAHRIGYPVLVRPSFVLGGRAMMIVYHDDDLRTYMRNATEVSPARPVLVDQFLENALEIDVDLISDGTTTVIGAIMEHIEEAGIHSGDSACTIPSFSLNETTEAAIRSAAHQLAKALDVCGLMNIQFAAKENQLYVLEVNPRASRTIPFVSKTIGVPLAKFAAKIMTREKTLVELGFTQEIIPSHYAVKEAVFPFVKFPGVDTLLGPEMKSTGEVMGIDSSLSMAFAKSQMAASASLPTKGNLFLSVKETHKSVIGAIARDFVDLGFVVFATKGTADAVEAAGVPVHRLLKLREGSPNVVDMLQAGQIALILNTPEGREPRQDEVRIRSFAAAHRVPILTTLRAARASIAAIRELQSRELTVSPLQDYHPGYGKRSN
jgi:carbamoyl-phosphate synthase large subunit